MTTDRGWRGAFHDLGHEQLRALPAGLEQVLSNGRQADEVARLDVVVADDRQVVGDVEAEVLCRSQNAQGLRVAGGEDGRRSIRPRRASVAARSRAS